jgi:hypothetical protein
MVEDYLAQRWTQHVRLLPASYSRTCSNRETGERRERWVRGNGTDPERVCVSDHAVTLILLTNFATRTLLTDLD